MYLLWQVLNACPFGAIFEISQAFDVLEGIRSGEKMIAIPAPSILGQFNTSIEAVYERFARWDLPM